MRPLFSTLFVVLMFSGCAEKVAPLTVEERSRFIAELLEDAPDCHAFRKRLAAAIKGSELDATYEEAKKASCLKRDV